MNRNHLGSFIRCRRHQLNLTPAALAQACHLGERSLKQMENGQGRPDCLTLRRLASALTLTASELVALAVRDLPRGGMLQLVSVEEEEPPP